MGDAAWSMSRLICSLRDVPTISGTSTHNRMHNMYTKHRTSDLPLSCYLIQSHLQPPSGPSNQFPAPSLRTLQSLLTNSRSIKPTRLKLIRRTSILIIKPNHRLIRFVPFLPAAASENLNPVFRATTRAASRIVAATDREHSSRPGD